MSRIARVCAAPLLLALAGFTVGCSQAAPGSGTSTELDPTQDCVEDSDADGLSDCEERALGTALHLADTDGDGFDDYREVVELGFSPDNNNCKFNPLIADTPRIRVGITSAPEITLFTSLETEVAIERSSESASSVTTGTSESNSHAVEWTETTGGSLTVGASASFPLGFSASAEATVSYEASTATSEETSLTWSQDQTAENRRGLSVVENQGKTIEGGQIAVTVDVENHGDVAYTLQNVAISATMSTPGLDAILSPVGSLGYADDLPSVHVRAGSR